MSVLWGFLERLLGPDALGHIPGRPDDHERQERIDRAVKQIEQIEKDVFTDQLRRAWRGENGKKEPPAC